MQTGELEAHFTIRELSRQVRDVSQYGDLKEGEAVECVFGMMKESMAQRVLSGSFPESNEQRALLWKMWLLHDPETACSVEEDEILYLDLIKRGKCREEDYNQIRKDSYRTAGLDHPKEEKELIRILSSFIQWKPFIKYSQHMSSVAYLLLQATSELEAFQLFSQLVTQTMGTYWTRDAVGSSAGRILASLALQQVDPMLAKEFEGSPYSFDSCVNSWFMRFLAHLKPGKEVVKLWDYLFAFGVHRIVYVVVALVRTQKNVLKERARIRSISTSQRSVLSKIKSELNNLPAKKVGTAQTWLEEVLEDDSLVKTPLEIFSEQKLLHSEIDAEQVISSAHFLSQHPGISPELHGLIKEHTTCPQTCLSIINKHR